MKHYVVVYDIPDDDRRNKVASILSGYGERVQLSVFECWLDRHMKAAMQEKVSRAIAADEDSVRIYCVSTDEVLVIGTGEALRPPKRFIV